MAFLNDVYFICQLQVITLLYVSKCVMIKTMANAPVPLGAHAKIKVMVYLKL